MGWLYGWDTKEELIAHLSKDDNSRYQIVGEPAVKGECLWMLLQDRQNPDLKLINLYVMRGADKTPEDDHGWGYTGESEASFPGYDSCPDALLKQSTCPDSRWREHQWVVRENKKLIASQLVEGAMVTQTDGRAFQLKSSLGRKGWRVQCQGSGVDYRMPLQTVKDLTRLRELTVARALFESSKSACVPSWDRISAATKERWLNRALGGQCLQENEQYLEDHFGPDPERIPVTIGYQTKKDGTQRVTLSTSLTEYGHHPWFELSADDVHAIQASRQPGDRVRIMMPDGYDPTQARDATHSSGALLAADDIQYVAGPYSQVFIDVEKHISASLLAQIAASQKDRALDRGQADVAENIGNLIEWLELVQASDRQAIMRPRQRTLV